MRPPDLPGGNPGRRAGRTAAVARRFNEAAGFTRRKPELSTPSETPGAPGFNEAAGFTRRKLPRSVGAM